MVRAGAERTRATTFAVLRSYSPSGLLVGTVVAAGAILFVSSVIAAYFGNDVLASISFFSNDSPCANDDVASAGVGVHCFGDYYQVVGFTRLSNPWAEHLSNYSAAGMIPNWFFGKIGDIAGSPRVGLIAFLAVIACALVVPALWASKGKALSLRVIAVSATGIVTIPALMALDRGNNTALAVPALLWFFAALRRGHLPTVIAAITLATLVRPQYMVLIAILFALRKWRLSIVAFASVGVTNGLAYLAWPSHFPATIIESFANVLHYGRQYSMATDYPPNASFGRGLYVIERTVRSLLGIEGHDDWMVRYGGNIGGLLAIALILAVIVRGSAIPPTVGAIVLLACATMFPVVTWSYYLVFCLPVAAIILRDPTDPAPDRHQWRGTLDVISERVRVSVATALLALAVAASLMPLILPRTLHVVVIGTAGRDDILATTGALVPVLWIAASIAVLATRWNPEERGPVGRVDGRTKGDEPRAIVAS